MLVRARRAQCLWYVYRVHQLYTFAAEVELHPPFSPKVHCQVCSFITRCALERTHKQQYAHTRCLESYYPESLNVILVNNPPWVFNGQFKLVFSDLSGD